MNTLATNDEAASKKPDRKIRVLLAKTGLDGHDRGLKIVAMFLRDAGIDVIFLGLHCTTETIVRAAIDEDVDLIGLSSLGGTQIAHSKELIEALAREGLGDLPVVIGGTIPVEDFPILQKIGVRAVLRAGARREEIVESVLSACGVPVPATVN